MIAENNRSIFHCAKCGQFLSAVRALVVGVDWDPRIKSVSGICKTHGRLETHTSWDWEEFYPEPAG